MSNIDGTIIDPGTGTPLPPDQIIPDTEPGEDHVGSDAVREPVDGDIRPIEPDPEEGNRPFPSDIERAEKD